jgi:hypothetical protein
MTFASVTTHDREAAAIENGAKAAANRGPPAGLDAAPHVVVQETIARHLRAYRVPDIHAPVPPQIAELLSRLASADR